jgi:pimeloyl-ACP methyl ester carboxylesterase
MPVDDLLALITEEPHPDLAYDPADDYRRLRCPVFLQYGAEDTSVPVAMSVQRITAALPESVRSRSAVRIYPDLEHMLNVIPPTVTGISHQEATHLFHGFRYGPGVKGDLTTWLRNVLTLGS